MRKAFFCLGLLSIVLLFCGCSKSLSEMEELTGGNMDVIYPENAPNDVSWISPGKVVVGNFYAGARAEWVMIIHNGGGVIVEEKLVISGTNDPMVEVILKNPLYMDSIENVLSVTSNLTDDILIIGDYNPSKRALTINGLIDNAERIIEVRYRTYTDYLVQYRHPDNVEVGYFGPPENTGDWLIVSDPTPVLEPFETREVLVALEIPKDAEIATPKWEFWVSVMDMTQGQVKIELASRWLIHMKQ